MKPFDLQNFVELKQECLICKECILSIHRSQVVFGDGNPSARLMIIGEAPGAMEDAQGFPFVGKAGQLLDRALNRAGILRSDIYVSNSVKCRPTSEAGGKRKNRAPDSVEVKACKKWIEQEIKLICPKAVLCLGSVSANSLIHPNFKIISERGTIFIKEGIKFVASFHPSYIARFLKSGECEQLDLLVKDLVLSKELSITA